MKTRIVSINYGMGNLMSVHNALAFLGYDTLISADPKVLEQADAYILPGVGAFGQAMSNLRGLGIVELLREHVVEKQKPFLGICLGMQLLAEESEEMGHNEGLGWIRGSVDRIRTHESLRLPHVGWNSLKIHLKHPLFAGIEPDSNFYFDHSYQLRCDESIVSAECNYGTRIVASIQQDNIFATQFHPEKSQVKGLKLLRSFLNYVESSKHTGLSEESV